jgi:hypothetical protein
MWKFSRTFRETMMPAKATADTGAKLLDKRLLQKVMANFDARMGFVTEVGATGESSQARMLAAGIKPEDRLLSAEIRRMRQEND